MPDGSKSRSYTSSLAARWGFRKLFSSTHEEGIFFLSNIIGRLSEQFFRRTQQLSSIRLASASSTAVDESEPPSDDALSTNFLSHQVTTIETEKDLRVCHFNANSIRARIETLRLFLAKQPIVEDSIIALKGYTLLRQDRRVNSRGVALFVHNSLTVVRLCLSLCDWTPYQNG